jgi:NhaP-type Na+/H+ or K+/H+ antiporter
VFGFFSALGLESISGGTAWFGDPTLAALIRAPIVIFGGLLLGLATGFGLSLLSCCHWIVYFLCLLTLSLGYVFTALAYNMSGLAYIAVLITCILSVRSRAPHEQKLAAMTMLTGWKVLEIILFALIGAAIDLQKIDGRTALIGVMLTVVGVGVKIPAAYFFFKGNLNPSERIYCTLCRLPKATIQASLGGVVLSVALVAQDSQYISYGHQILTCAALSIILTAPLAAIISTWSPKLLTLDKPTIEATTSVKPPPETMSLLQQMRATHSAQKESHKD